MPSYIYDIVRSRAHGNKCILTLVANISRIVITGIVLQIDLLKEVLILPQSGKISGG
jgi:hypothetical protein